MCIRDRAMGVPVLTNNIGIEGIEVDDGIHYYHCETPEDYNGKIRYIIQNRDEAEKVAQNALKFINDNYNLKNSFKEDVYKRQITEGYGKSIMQNCEFWN